VVKWAKPGQVSLKEEEEDSHITYRSQKLKIKRPKCLKQHKQETRYKNKYCYNNKVVLPTAAGLIYSSDP